MAANIAPGDDEVYRLLAEVLATALRVRGPAEVLAWLRHRFGEPPPVYDIPTLAAMGVGSPRAIYRLMASGELVYCQTPGGRVVRRSDLEAYLMARRSA
jgi:hypothetical protein